MLVYNYTIASLTSIMYKGTQTAAYSRSKLPYPEYSSTNYSRNALYSIGKQPATNSYQRQHYNGTNLNNNQIKYIQHANQYNYSREQKEAERNLKFQKTRFDRQLQEKRQKEKMMNEMKIKSTYNHREQQKDYYVRTEQKQKGTEVFSNRKQGYGHHEEESNGKRMGREESGYKEVIFKEIGLNNIGNTCFMNSILQCMINLPSFNDYFMANQHLKEMKDNGKVASAYGKLVKMMKNSIARSQNPSELKYAISCKKPRFSGYAQQDAQQFLAALLETLSLQLNRSKNPRYKELSADLTKQSLQQISNDWWSYNKERQNSIVCDYFTGQLLSRVVCTTCKYESIAFDNTWDFALNFTNNDNGQIPKMISNFLKEELISSDYYCSKCKAFRQCRRKLDFYRLPKIMILQIKRFTYGKYSKQKLNNKIKVSQILNLSDLISYPNDVTMKNPVYRLFGIVNHSGDLNFGHYTADCFNPNNQKWYNFNDAHVSETRIGDKFQSSNPYLLFYVKIK